MEKTRLETFIDELREWADNDSDIAAGLDNGEILCPDWVAISMDNDHMKVWDNENGSAQMGFITLMYR